MIKHSHWKGQRLRLQRKTNNDKVKQNLVELSLFIWGPGVFWPILWAATLPYFCSQRNVCMNLSACRNLICRRDKRNYALRFKSWRGVQTSVSLRLMGVNISQHEQIGSNYRLVIQTLEESCRRRHLPAGRRWLHCTALPGCGGPFLCSLSRLPQWKRGFCRPISSLDQVAGCHARSAHCYCPGWRRQRPNSTACIPSISTVHCKLK